MVLADFKSVGVVTETKELVAGFWLWQVKSKEEAIEWVERAPFGGGAEIEIRQVFEAEDFGAEFTPELRAQEKRIRAQATKKKGDPGDESCRWTSRPAARFLYERKPEA